MIPEILRSNTFAFLVPAPHTASNSNGIRVLIDAALSVIDLGVKAVIVPSHDTVPAYHKLPEPYHRVPISWEVPEGCCAIVSDTVLPELLSQVRARAKYVCHYTLAPWGLFQNCGVYSNFQMIAPGERQAVYSSHVSTHFPCFYLQTQFKELEPWLDLTHARAKPESSRAQQRQLKVCIYAGKGRLFSLGTYALRRRISRSESSLILRWDPRRGTALPPTKPELYSLLACADLLISYDPLSSLAHEATLLGTPCLVKAGWDEIGFKDSFPVRLDGISWNSEERALDLVDHGYNHASVVSSYKEAIKANSHSLMGLMAFACGQGDFCLTDHSINSYWNSRQPYFSSLRLPSEPSDWGPISKALQPLGPADLLADFTEELPSLIIQFRRRLKRVMHVIGIAKLQLMGLLKRTAIFPLRVIGQWLQR